MGVIEEKDLIHFEMSIVFFYKDCEVTLKKVNQIYFIKIIGISDFGNLLSASRVFEKKVDRKIVIDYLEREIENIHRVYESVLSKEFGMDNNIN
ncbi:MAG: hypothetical protein IMZ63_03805 [Actinobacteria bacterium]|nr:hypothetical protein [Actinomycetota bacterium]